MGIVISHFQFISSLFYISKRVIVLRMTMLFSKYVGSKLQLKLENGVFTPQMIDSGKYITPLLIYLFNSERQKKFIKQNYT